MYCTKIIHMEMPGARSATNGLAGAGAAPHGRPRPRHRPWPRQWRSDYRRTPGVGCWAAPAQDPRRAPPLPAPVAEDATRSAEAAGARSACMPEDAQTRSMAGRPRRSSRSGRWWLAPSQRLRQAAGGCNARVVHVPSRDLS